jgi:ABC-2 type transport system ATP-binding protein
MNAVESAGLGKRFRRTWALRHCTLAIPDGHVVALVGPNGAGKTTLLHMTVGLTAPTAGTVTVLGGEPAGSPQALDRVAFVAQDAPLYQNLPARDMLHVARNLNRRWDQQRAERRLAELGIPLARKVGKLSGGQQAQLALTIALARRPELLILDEPLAMLDPLARHEFMASVMAAVAEDGVSVVLSSHVLAELERVADYLIVLAHDRVQVAGEVDDLLAGHRMLTRFPVLAPAADRGRLAASAGADPRRGHHLAGPPPGRVSHRRLLSPFTTRSPARPGESAAWHPRTVARAGTATVSACDLPPSGQVTGQPQRGSTGTHSCRWPLATWAGCWPRGAWRPPLSARGPARCRPVRPASPRSSRARPRCCASG